MIKKFQTKKAQSTMEIIVMFMFVVGALLVFQKYMAQGLYGRWKGSGDAWSFGRQYDKNKTTECVYNVWGTNGKWYESDCFETQCKASCLGGVASPSACDTCLESNCIATVSGVDVCNN